MQKFGLIAVNTINDPKLENSIKSTIAYLKSKNHSIKVSFVNIPR